MTGTWPAAYRLVIREHVYDKCWTLDVTWAEVEALLTSSRVVEEVQSAHGVKQVRLLVGWRRPLHLVCVINHLRQLIVVITVYEPDLDHWLPGFEQRRR